MAATTAETGGEASRSGATADSFIGSSISLTSKFEIRYEGVLYNINTEESSIGLRNVRSFGTEGRKKDGPQIPPSDKVYEYILFRGSDIKDLQVKSSPPIQTPAPVHNDPAIIQSHYSHPTPTPSSMQSLGSGTTPVAVPDLGSHAGSDGMPRTTFQGSVPLYQPGGSLGTWGPSPLNANNSDLGMPPMYWQGFYPPSGGPSHLQQPPFLRPPPGLSMPPSMQQSLQYPAINSSLPSASQTFPVINNTSLPSGTLNFPGPSSSLLSGTSSVPEVSPYALPPVSGTITSSSASLLASVAPTQATPLAPEMSSTMLSNNSIATSLPTTTLTTNFPFVSHSASKPELTLAPDSGKRGNISGQNIAFQTVQAMSQPLPATVGLPSSSRGETSRPSLVTPDQLLQPVSASIPTSQPLQADLEELKTKALTEPVKLSSSEASRPILPLPSPMDHKPNAVPLHSYSNNRGRGRGRGNGYSRPTTKFTEDFDFTAMNEKFKKDEVWGDLGKTKSEDHEYDDYAQHDEDVRSSRDETKPVYVKDDFFDSLSCNSLDHANRNGRTKFSEQRKIDTETFGELPRYHGNRGGGRGFRGGRSRGSYNYNRGYGYAGRGRGHPT